MSTAIFRGKARQDFIYVDTHEMRLRHTKRRCEAWANAVNDLLHQGVAYTIWTVALTYERVGDWSANDIKRLMQRVRRHFKHQLVAYAWVAELQERGAVHYHLALLLDGRNVPCPYFDQNGFWPYGSTNTRRRYAVSARYLVDYIQKSEQKRDAYPKGLRIFAVVIRARWLVDAKNYFEFRVAALPAYVRHTVRAMIVALGAANDWILSRTWRMGHIELDGWQWKPDTPKGGWFVRYRKLWRVAVADYKFLGIEDSSYNPVAQDWAVDL